MGTTDLTRDERLRSLGSCVNEWLPKGVLCGHEAAAHLEANMPIATGTTPFETYIPGPDTFGRCRMDGCTCRMFMPHDAP